MLGTRVPLFKGFMVYVQKQQPDNFQITSEDQKTQHERGAKGKMVLIQASVETAFESSLGGWGRQGRQAEAEGKIPVWATASEQCSQESEN